MYTAKWTGVYPTLCFGTWKLYKDNEDISDKIPADIREDEMNTFGEYEYWAFDDDYMEYWTPYKNGLETDDWIKENDYWLNDITTNYSEKVQIFNAINAEDWRHGSCGGCI